MPKDSSSGCAKTANNVDRDSFSCTFTTLNFEKLYHRVHGEKTEISEIFYKQFFSVFSLFFSVISVVKNLIDRQGRIDFPRPGIDSPTQVLHLPETRRNKQLQGSRGAGANAAEKHDVLRAVQSGQVGCQLS